MRIICRYESTLIFFIFSFASFYIIFYLLIDFVIGIAHLLLPYEPPKNRELKAFITSAYYYPTSKSLGDNALALVMSMNLGKRQKDYMEMQSGAPMDFAEIVVWAKNGTTSRLVSTPYIRVTPHDYCQMITVFATVQLMPNVKNILLVSDDGSTEVPFVIPSYRKRDLVVCLSPLYVAEQWQNFLLTVHIYKRYGGFLNVYLISCISSFFALMKKYESAGYLNIQPWYRVNFPYILPQYADPFVGIEFQNQAAAHTDCLLQYKEAAEFVTFVDMDDILIPRLAPTYVEEFHKIIANKKRVAYIVFRQENYKVNVAIDGSKFSIDSTLRSLTHQKWSEKNGKLVANPQFINFTWIYPTPTYLNGMNYFETSDNYFIHLKNIKWTNSISTNPIQNYPNTTEPLISNVDIDELEVDYQRMIDEFEIDLIFPDFPRKLFYFNSVTKCLKNNYYNYLNSGSYGYLRCPGPQMCEFPKYRDVKCVHVNATHIFMEKLYPITYYFASGPYFTADIGCVPH
ncbi:unnamed protein product [Caenorhabditis brenneri]